VEPRLLTTQTTTVKLFASLVLLLSYALGFAATKTATITGNWSNGSIWSPSGVPAPGDDIIINSGITVTIDSIFACNDLDLGNSTGSNTTLRITTAGKSLVVNGDFRMNPNDKNNTYTLEAGPGSISLAGTFSKWSNTGTNQFKISTGTLSFAPSVTIDDNGKKITFSDAGTVTFYADFTDEEDNLTTFAGCNVNFYGNYTVTGSNTDWATKGTANFYGTGTLTHTKNIILNHVNIMADATTTLPAGAGTFRIEGDLVLNSSSTFNMNCDFELDGSLTNNGGTISAGAYTLTMNCSVCYINGTTSLSLPTVKIGGGATNRDVSVTVSRSSTMSALTFAAGSKNRTLNLNSAAVDLTISGALTMNQPTTKKKTALLSVGAGSCTVSGNLTFAGGNNTTTRVCRISTTSGSFTLNGTLTWMSNTAVATEEITTATGTLTFASAISMGSGSGTLKATGAGTINFNSTSSPCFTFGGSTTPVFGTAYSCTVNFAKGITTNTTALTFSTGSNAVFNGTATITPNSTITFANFEIGTGYTVTAAGSFAVKGDWTNNGAFTPSTHTVTFNGSGTQTINNSSGTETFYKVTLTPYGTVIEQACDVVVTNTLTLSGASVDMNGYTFQLGNGSGAALSYSLGQLYNGTWKRYWPSGTAITSTSGNYYGLFPIGATYEYRPITINSTANATTGGYVMATHTDTAGVKSVSYTDNDGSNIEQIALMNSEITTSGLVGGTYNIGVKFTGLGTQGNVSNLKLLTYTSDVTGSCGTHVTTAGPIGAPTGYRNGLSVTNLNNRWVLGTNDKSATPLYNYVYSRKTSGNWNDNGANGTWSYTPGGAGAACNCVPGGSGYAVIESGQTVTVTASDSVKFLDIADGGTLVINNARTFYIRGNLVMEGEGNFTNNGTLDVTGELYMTSSTSPSVNGDVRVRGWFTLNSGASYTQSDGTLTVNGDMDISGTMSMASGTSLVFDGNGAKLKGTGTYTTASGGSFPISNNKLVYPGTNLTIGSSGTNTTLSIAANTFVNNVGIINLYGNLTGANGSTSIWMNNATSELNITGTLLSTGILDAETAPNTVNYCGTGAQTVKAPATAYYNLKAINGGTKSLAADVIVDNNVTLGSSTILDAGTYFLSGNGGLTMSGTSELKLQRSVEDVTPELAGTYNLTGGTVTINQTADSAIVREAVYYNLKLNGSTPYDISAVSQISNNLDVTNTASVTQNSILTVGGTFTHSSSGTTTITDSIAVYGIILSGGTVRDGATWYEGGQSINVTGAGGWNKNGGTFTVSDGTVLFTGSDNQSLSGTGATQTFNNIHVNKTGGTVTVGGSTSTLSMNGNMTITAGTLAAGTATAINMTAGNWINNGGTFTPGSGTVTFNGTVDQAIQGEAIATDFNNLTVNKSAGVLSVGGSIATINTSGNVTLTTGELDAGAATFNLTAGNWTNNGGTFTPATGTVTFSGSGAQAINGTAAAQTFNHLRVNKSANTLSVSGSTTALTVGGNMTLDAGTFDKGTAANIYAQGNWTNNGATFTYGTGTVHFTGSAEQLINGTSSAQSFYHTTVNKAANSVSIGSSTTSLTVNGNMTLTAGTLDGGTGSTIYMTGGNWANNGGTFTPRNSNVVFNSTAGAQAINGTAAAQTFNSITVDKTSQTLSIGGSTTALTLNGDMILTSGTFDKGTAADIYTGGNWTNNGGTFTYGTGTVYFNGTGSQEINGTASAQSFYNTTVNKSGGTLAFGGSTNTLNVNNLMTLSAGAFSAGSATINMLGSHWVNNGGTFTPGTSTVVFSNTAADQAINGTAASQTFHHITMNKTGRSLGVSGSTTTLTLNGNLTLTAGSFVPNTATALNVGGNFTNNATYTAGSGTVIFNGSSTQNISGSSSTAFNGLTLNNTSGGVRLNTAASVNGALTLTSGVLTTTASEILTLGASATSTSGSASSHVAGPMKKIGNTSFVFPVGKGGKWRRVGVSAMTNATTEITAEYFAQGYTDTTSLDVSLDKVSPNEYWMVDRTVTSDPVKIKLYWEDADASSIENCDFLTIAHFTGGQWQREEATATGGSVCSGNGSGSLEMNGTVSTFSPFGFGSYGGGGALPVELVSFTAEAKAGVVKTKWITAIEINNDYFTVERSDDGVNFKMVGKVDGAGNSTQTLAYSFIDTDPLEGVSYYRLKQTDYDGQFSYSDIVMVRTTVVEEVKVSVFPNPAQSEVNIQLSNVSDDVQISIYDQFGKLMYANVYPSTGSRSAQNIQLNVSNILSAGVYFLNVSANQTVYKEKLVIQ
jgi:hypothetical protein